MLLVTVFAVGAQAQLKNNKYHEPIKVAKKWKKYNPGDVIFRDESPESEGSQIYHRIITLKEYDGVSEKYGHGDHVGIRYSTKWIERSFAGNDTMKLDYETRGVLYHELTHAYQLEPKNCGNYSDGGEYWCFIEGMADAVRLACGCFEQDFQSKDRPRAETWRKGYRVAGYFLWWIQQTKDKNFLRKFNRSAAELDTWSWDAAMKHVLGNKPENGVEALWDEYRKAIGEK